MRVKDEQISTRLHSIASAAEFLGGLSVSTIRRWIAIGQLNALKVGRRVMIRETELLRLIKPQGYCFPGTGSGTNFSEVSEMTDAIDELVARSKDHLELRAFHEFHRKHRELLDFLVEEIRLRIDRGFPAFSFPSLWSYGRWKLETLKGPSVTFKMNDHLQGFYSRAVVILYPEFNGRAEFRPALADEVFGTQIEQAPKKRTKNYARRLQWATGQRIEDGWRPTVQHIPGVVLRKPDIH